MEEIKKSKILLVDDVEMNLVILSEIIATMGHEPLTALSAKAALSILEKELPSLILLDVSMPDMSGLEFCELLKKDVYTREIPVIFISALDSAEDLSKGFEMGAVDYIFKPFDPKDIQLRVDNHLKLYNMQRELEDANHRLNNVVKQHMSKNREMQKQFLTVISELIDDKCSFNTHYCGSEAKMVRKLAQALMFSDEFENEINESFVDNIEMAALVHDMGMLNIADSIALKPGKVNGDEWDILTKHVIYGSEKVSHMFGDDEDAELKKFINNVVMYHHERYDGTGYPEGLSGKDIPLEARIMAIIDVYDALVNERCYKDIMEQAEAMAVIEEGAGTAFDPDIVKVFKKIERQFAVKTK